MAEQEVTLSAHDAAMVAKVDGTSAALNPQKETAAAVVAPRPDNIPEKFWDAEKGVTRVDELAKSYAELEKGRSAPVADPVAAKVAADAAAAAGSAGAGVDFAALTSEYAADGKLSEARYTELAAQGNPRHVVDAFIAGQAATARVAEYEAKEAVTEAHSHAGGKDAFDSMLSWASVNLNAADQAAFDTAVMGNAASRKQAITSLRSQYTASRGSDPKLVSGSGSAGESFGAFQSRAEVTAAMRDPRYKADPAYRSSVERRIGAMPVF
jgi:hypothetical protein